MSAIEVGYVPGERVEVVSDGTWVSGVVDSVHVFRGGRANYDVQREADDKIVVVKPAGVRPALASGDMVCWASVAGDRGTATAGYGGTATAGNRGTATAGDSGVISIQYWDSKAERSKVMIGYIGEGGLKPGVAYQLDENCQFVEKPTS